MQPVVTPATTPIAADEEYDVFESHAYEDKESFVDEFVEALRSQGLKKKCLSPAKKYKLYKSSINKSIHFVQRSLSSSTGPHWWVNW